MGLLGKAAMLLFYDIVPSHMAEHDEWHTREHFPERVSIPGFLRAQRWVAMDDGQRYMVIYEVADIDVLSGAPYLERLNNPTPWTRRMMPHFVGMTRGFCNIDSRCGPVLGTASAVCRFTPLAGREQSVREWIDGSLLPALVERPGIASAFLLSSARTPEMTAEQRIRGRDANVDSVLVVTGHSPDATAAIVKGDLSAHSVGVDSASIQSTHAYRLACIAGRIDGHAKAT